MRSIDEAFYFEVLFRELGVTVWYACDPMLNAGDLNAKMLKFSKYFPAEGSNVERITKSISGQTAALKEGRWTFNPKPGYRRGYEKGVPEPDPVRGPILKDILARIASRRLTPTTALKELNSSDFMKDHAPYKMDKFRKIIKDPFYAGILEIDKQIKVRNENGLHEPLITKEQHYFLVQIIEGKPKNQSGPRKNGNPKYPANNIAICDNCLDKRNGRFVGFDHTNGKTSKIYERYRCRSCGRYLTREEMHFGINQQFINNPITEDGRNDFIDALKIVWKQRKANSEQESSRIRHKITALGIAIERQIDELSDPSNNSFKERIKSSISKKENEISKLEEELENLHSREDDDWQKFLRFSFDFIDQMGTTFLEAKQENRLRCKQIMFPAGFFVNENKIVYTPGISPLITLLPIKKDAEASIKTHLVRVKRL